MRRWPRTGSGWSARASASRRPIYPTPASRRPRCGSRFRRAGLATTPTEAQALRQHIADKLAAETAVNAWGGRGWLRLSAQVYNRPDEYDRLAERLPPLLSALQR